MGAYYCNQAGAGAHDGTSLLNAWTWAEAIAAINAASTIGNDDELRVCGDIDHGGSGQTIVRVMTATTPIRISGYNSDGDTPALVDIGSTTKTVGADVLLITGSGYVLSNLKFRNGDTSYNGLYHSAGSGSVACYNVHAHDCGRGIYIKGDYGVIVNCRAYDNSSDGIKVEDYRNAVHGCVMHDNGGRGIQTDTHMLVTRCISAFNTLDGFKAARCSHCTSHDNGTTGFIRNVTSYATLYFCCISTDNGTYGYQGANAILVQCASRGNGVARSTGVSHDIDGYTLTSDPYSGASYDFQLNDTAGGGLEMRDAAFFPGGVTANLDIGAVQRGE